MMEAMQPSLMSRLAPIHNRGMVMGFFSSSQFLGASMGGLLASVVYGYFAIMPVLLIGAGLLALWFIIVIPMQNPQKKAESADTVATRERQEAIITSEEAS